MDKWIVAFDHTVIPSELSSTLMQLLFLFDWGIELRQLSCKLLLLNSHQFPFLFDQKFRDGNYKHTIYFWQSIKNQMKKTFF